MVDYLNGIDEADKELSRYTHKAISTITWMEILVGATPEEDAALRTWLRTFEVMEGGKSSAPTLMRFCRATKAAQACDDAAQLCVVFVGRHWIRYSIKSEL
ncbi:MAG: hypothetical protein LBT71_10430 [Azoarcus sp.]|nr:hypothetical protein [Azoarcus sp.]